MQASIPGVIRKVSGHESGWNKKPPAELLGEETGVVMTSNNNRRL